MKKIIAVIIIALAASVYFPACTKSRDAFKIVFKDDGKKTDVLSAHYGVPLIPLTGATP
jgi:hypothetical protein